jgi:predicted RNA-binding Zn-ribbon protein involved in translation (DUF1610 family)
MMSVSIRLNGKQLARNYNPKLRLECQHCQWTVRTKKLEFDIICPRCGKYAKRADQELITLEKFDKTRKQYYLFYRVKYPLTENEAILP